MSSENEVAISQELPQPMKCRLFLFALLLVYPLGATPLLLQSDQPGTGLDAEAIQSALDELPDSDSSAGATDGASETLFDESCELIPDEHTRNVCWEMHMEYLRYYKWGYEQRKSVILFQNFSTKAILVVVISLVLLGMYFAWYQFRIAMQAMRLRVKAGESVENASEREEIKIGASEIVARSSYLGVTILIVSLAFFYLYLVFVYPIEEIF
jgi:hypothetical protein